LEIVYAVFNDGGRKMEKIKKVGNLVYKYCLMICLSILFVSAFGTDCKAASQKGTIHSVAISAWSWGKAGQEMMYDRLDTNGLSGYSNDVHTFSFDTENGNYTNIKNINQVINAGFKNSKDNDINIFYFTGHSLNGWNKKPVGLVLGRDDKQQYTFYPWKDLAKELAKYKGKIVVILETCHAEVFYSQGVAKLSAADKKRFSCIFSCGSNETSKAGSISKMPYLFSNGYSYGIFTYALGEGLGFWNGKIKADSNNDGKVTVQELYTYASKHTDKSKLKKMTVKMYSFDPDLALFSYPVELNETQIVMYESQVENLTAKVGGITVSPDWKSSNLSIVNVVKGKITAKKAGTASVTATINGTKAVCKITVKAPAISLNKTTATLYTSGTTSVTLKATVYGKSQKVTWKSSNTSVVAVKNGKVTAKKQGTATITATANGVNATCEVTVKEKKTVQVAQVSCGGAHTAILKTDGSLWMCGDNGDGQLGDGTTTDKSKPVKVMSNVKSVSCGSYHTTIMKND
jgi:hypothetical protein